jgi:hypothetical protein
MMILGWLRRVALSQGTMIQHLSGRRSCNYFNHFWDLSIRYKFAQQALSTRNIRMRVSFLLCGHFKRLFAGLRGTVWSEGGRQHSTGPRSREGSSQLLNQGWWITVLPVLPQPQLGYVIVPKGAQADAPIRGMGEISTGLRWTCRGAALRQL